MRLGRCLPPAAAPIGLREVLSGISAMLYGGKALERFRLELKQYFGVKHCFLISSGRAAFTMILWALQELYPDRDEVVIPAFTCYTVPSSVLRAGLRIRLCDLNADSFEFDLKQLYGVLSRSSTRPGGTGSSASTGDGCCQTRDAGDNHEDSPQRVLAVVPTHLFGFPADVASLRQLFRDSKVTIVEDAAQAMGETCDAGKLGTLGDVSFFSLGRGKAFSTVEGGVILTDRDDIADALRRRVNSLAAYGPWQLVTLIAKAIGLMIFGRPVLFWVPRSMPFLRIGETLFELDFPIRRMSSFQAGLTVNWRERLQKMREVRRANVKRWTNIVEEISCAPSWSSQAQSLALLRLPIKVRNSAKRDSLLRDSADDGAGIMPVYPKSINLLSELQGLISGDTFPIAESYARELVTLPTHSFVTQDDLVVGRQLLSEALRVTTVDHDEKRSAPV